MKNSILDKFKNVSSKNKYIGNNITENVKMNIKTLPTYEENLSNLSNIQINKNISYSQGSEPSIIYDSSITNEGKSNVFIEDNILSESNDTEFELPKKVGDRSTNNRSIMLSESNDTEFELPKKVGDRSTNKKENNRSMNNNDRLIYEEKSNMLSESSDTEFEIPKNLNDSSYSSEDLIKSNSIFDDNLHKKYNNPSDFYKNNKVVTLNSNAEYNLCPNSNVKIIYANPESGDICIVLGKDKNYDFDAGRRIVIKDISVQTNRKGTSYDIVITVPDGNIKLEHYSNCDYKLVSNKNGTYIVNTSGGAVTLSFYHGKTYAWVIESEFVGNSRI
mgnify:CR=1 FL=1